MIKSLHQPPDSASLSVSTSADVGHDVTLLCEQCGLILLCVWGSDVRVTEVCMYVYVYVRMYVSTYVRI